MPEVLFRPGLGVEDEAVLECNSFLSIRANVKLDCCTTSAPHPVEPGLGPAVGGSEQDPRTFSPPVVAAVALVRDLPAHLGDAVVKDSPGVVGALADKFDL